MVAGWPHAPRYARRRQTQFHDAGGVCGSPVCLHANRGRRPREPCSIVATLRRRVLAADSATIEVEGIVRKAWLLVTASAIASALFGAGAAAAPTAWPACPASATESVAQLRAEVRSGELRGKLWPHICGPRKVIPGKNYSFTVVVTNISDTSYRRLKLSVSHYDPITRASLPYRGEAAANGDPLMRGAVWMMKNFRAGRSFRVSFTLPFKRRPDPKGSNFEVDAYVAQGPVYSTDILGMTHDVVFIRHSSSP